MGYYPTLSFRNARFLFDQFSDELLFSRANTGFARGRCKFRDGSPDYYEAKVLGCFKPGRGRA
jgi:hypothetical protein